MESLNYDKCTHAFNPFDTCSVGKRKGRGGYKSGFWKIVVTSATD